MYNIPFEFVIDTDSYSGNFERELCAYVTGYWDEETHGGDQAEIFKREVGDPEEFFGDYITTATTQDDDMTINTYQCLELEPSRKYYHSVGIFFEKKPSLKLIALMKERSYKFAKEGRIFDRLVKIKVLGFRLLKRTVKIKEVTI